MTDANPPVSVLKAWLLEDLGDAEKTCISNECRWARYAQGSSIVSYQDASQDVLFLQSGRARVTLCSANGRQVIFRDVEPGDMIGELSALDGAPRSADVMAVDDCVVASLSGIRFRELLFGNPAVMHAQIIHLTGLVRDLTDRQLELSTLPIRYRLCAYLLRSAQTWAETEQWTTVKLPTHQLIASQVGCLRETITKELRRLEKCGGLRRHEGRTQVCPEHLQMLLASAD